jgi:glyoxylase-like metal-dependent hydrolase (beta-lactamase superfamily II)
LKESSSLADNDAIRRYVLDVEVESVGDGFRLCLPNRAAGERDTLSVGDLTVLFYHMPGIHTRSNMTLFIPELGIVFGRREFAYAAQMKLEPGADPQKIVRVLEDILSSGKSIRYLIPGHGEAIHNPDLNAGVKCLNGRDFR